MGDSAGTLTSLNQMYGRVKEFRSLTVLANQFNGPYCRLTVPCLNFIFCVMFMLYTLLAARLNRCTAATSSAVVATVFCLFSVS